MKDGIMLVSAVCGPLEGEQGAPCEVKEMSSHELASSDASGDCSWV